MKYFISEGWIECMDADVEIEDIEAECNHLDKAGECYPADSTCPDCGIYIAPFPEE